MFPRSTQKFSCARRLSLRALLVFSLLSANAFAGSVTLAWNAVTTSTLAGYKLYYGTSSGNYGTPVDVGKVTTATVSGLTNGATYYFAAKAYDTSGNLSAFSNQVSATVSTTAPVASFTATPTSGYPSTIFTFTDTSTGSITSRTWNFGDGTTSTALQASKTYSSPGTYTVTLTVNGSYKATKTITVMAATSGSTSSSSSTSTTSSGSTATTQGPVAAYGFEEGNGTIVADLSGTGNTGTISGATWTTAGKYGKALVFNGTSALVTVKDSASLRLATAMTLEAWVKPSVVNRIWQDVIYKADDNYYLEATSSNGGKPAANVKTNSGGTGAYGTSALPTSTWTHLAVTYNGAALTLYVNGNPVSSVARTGSLATSTNPLQIGGDSLYGQYFQGTIDEVRIYNRALSQAEIKTDSTKSVISSSAAKFLVGDQSIEPNVDYNGQGVAQAFSTVAQASGTVTNLQVYVDSSSTATELVAGIYSNNNGHPGTLLAQGKLASPGPGKWNQVSISGATISAGQTYWMAILGSQGVLRFRDTKTGQVTTETSASATLTTLPTTWATGGVWQDFGAVSVYGVGN